VVSLEGERFLLTMRLDPGSFIGVDSQLRPIRSLFGERENRMSLPSSASLSQNLVDLACLSVNEEPDPLQILPHTEELIASINRLLDHRQNACIRRALEILDLSHQDEAYEALSFWVDEATASIDVALSLNGIELSGQAQIFLMPLIFTMAPGVPIPQFLSEQALRGILLPSLRTYHFVSENESTIYTNGLYPLGALPSSWSTRRRWLKQLVSAASDHPTGLPLPPPSPVPSNHPQLALRFVIGAVLTGDEDENPGWISQNLVQDLTDAEPDNDSQLETFIAQIHPWQASLAADLTRDWMGTLASVLPGLPNPWDPAIADGVEAHNVVVADLAVSRIAAAERPDISVRVTRSPSLANASWAIHLDHPEFRQPWPWYGTTGSAARDLADLMALLRFHGFRKITIAPFE